MNDGNFSACRDSALVVPYMYGELSASDCASFESHLLDCGDCTDNFADISNARYEVYEWKKLEFEPLATPRIEIPYNNVPLAQDHTWFDKVRAALSRGWSVPGFALGALAIMATFGALVIMTRDGGNDSVGTANLDVPVVSNSATGESSLPTVSSRVDNERARDAFVSNPIGTEAAIHDEPRRRNQARKKAPRKLIETRPMSAQNLPKSAPSLNEFAEDEDTSLRLAELLDDIETSD